MSAKKIITNKTGSAEPAQLLLTSTLLLKLVKATSFVATMNNWLMESANVKPVSTESTVSAQDAIQMLISILSPKAADATKDTT